MKKVISIVAISAIAFGAISIANASPSIFSNNENNQKHCNKHERKDLHLTQDQAKQLITAILIKHGKSATKEINKIDTITLKENKSFYLVYVTDKGQDKNTRFFIVNAQNGNIKAYPGHHKFQHKVKLHFKQNHKE